MLKFVAVFLFVVHGIGTDTPVKETKSRRSQTEQLLEKRKSSSFARASFGDSAAALAAVFGIPRASRQSSTASTNSLSWNSESRPGSGRLSRHSSTESQKSRLSRHGSSESGDGRLSRHSSSNAGCDRMRRHGSSSNSTNKKGRLARLFASMVDDFEPHMVSRRRPANKEAVNTKTSSDHTGLMSSGMQVDANIKTKLDQGNYEYVIQESFFLRSIMKQHEPAYRSDNSCVIPSDEGFAVEDDYIQLYEYTVDKQMYPGFHITKDTKLSMKTLCKIIQTGDHHSDEAISSFVAALLINCEFTDIRLDDELDASFKPSIEPGGSHHNPILVAVARKRTLILKYLLSLRERLDGTRYFITTDELMPDGKDAIEQSCIIWPFEPYLNFGAEINIKGVRKDSMDQFAPKTPLALAIEDWVYDAQNDQCQCYQCQRGKNVPPHCLEFHKSLSVLETLFSFTHNIKINAAGNLPASNEQHKIRDCYDSILEFAVSTSIILDRQLFHQDNKAYSYFGQSERARMNLFGKETDFLEMVVRHGAHHGLNGNKNGNSKQTPLDCLLKFLTHFPDEQDQVKRIAYFLLDNQERLKLDFRKSFHESLRWPPADPVKGTIAYELKTHHLQLYIQLVTMSSRQHDYLDGIHDIEAQIPPYREVRDPFYEGNSQFDSFSDGVPGFRASHFRNSFAKLSPANREKCSIS